MVDAAASFEQISKHYAAGPLGWTRRNALHGVSLQVNRGEIFGLVGPNRAGKTTLVKMLLSLCRPTGGTLQRLGRPSADRSTLARVGYVHENQAFPRYLTATELLHYYGALSLLPEPTVRERVPTLLERVQLADRGREPISRFSKGMIQRLGIAQALFNEPELLVLDEPTEGLDLQGRQLLHDVLLSQRERGGTAILISHLLDEVERTCNRIGVLMEGRLVFQGTVAQLGGGHLSFEQALSKLYSGKPKV